MHYSSKVAGFVGEDLFLLVIFLILVHLIMLVLCRLIRSPSLQPHFLSPSHCLTKCQVNQVTIITASFPYLYHSVLVKCPW